MRLNYDTFTGRRSAFVIVAASLCLLSWVVLSVCGPTLVQLLRRMSMSDRRIDFILLLVQNGLIVASALIAASLTERDRSMKDKLGLTMDSGYSLRFLFPVFVITVLSTLLAQVGLTYLLRAFGREPKPQAVVEMFRNAKPLTFVAFAMITLIAAPIAEELAFRHILYRLVRVVLYRKEAAVLVSLVFALFHVPLVAMFHTKPFPWEMLVIPVVPLFILALFLQWQYERSKSVIPSVLLHAGFNLINVILLAFEVFCAPPQKTPETTSGPAAPSAVEAPADVSGPAAPSTDAAPSGEAPAPAAVPVEAVVFPD